MSQVATFTPSIAGDAPTYAAAAAGDTGRVGDVLIVKNASEADVTVTMTTPATLVTGDAYPDKEYTVAAGGEAWIPLLAEYASTADGLAHWTYSDVTSVTRAVVARVG